MVYILQERVKIIFIFICGSTKHPLDTSTIFNEKHPDRNMVHSYVLNYVHYVHYVLCPMYTIGY